MDHVKQEQEYHVQRAKRLFRERLELSEGCFNFARRHVQDLFLLSTAVAGLKTLLDGRFQT